MNETKCPACEFEEEFGTEGLPFPLDDRLHSCEGETVFSWKSNPVRVERERANQLELDLKRWICSLWDASHNALRARWESNKRFWAAIDSLSHVLDRRERPTLEGESR